MSWKSKGELFLATGLGLGLLAPFAPGTIGSLPGYALAFLTTRASLGVQIFSALALTCAAVPICSSAERQLGLKDDGRISADEWMLYPLAVVGLPLGDLPWWASLLFFAVVRGLDIIKPPPARAWQVLPGGLGIVIDDLVANLYALGLNWVLYLWVLQPWVR